MKKILLNVCCAPDAAHSINVLRGGGYESTTFFYNPNIHPENEYIKRFNNMKKLAEDIKVKNINNIPYNSREWFNLTAGYEKEPEGGRRCAICFKIRLEKTAQAAKELKFMVFATTLTISPHKDAGLINMLGKDAAAEYGVEYYESDFKKKDGFKKSIELSKKHGLYRQGYCGCVYSLRERNSRKKRA